MHSPHYHLHLKERNVFWSYWLPPEHNKWRPFRTADLCGGTKMTKSWIAHETFTYTTRHGCREQLEDNNEAHLKGERSMGQELICSVSPTHLVLRCTELFEEPLLLTPEPQNTHRKRHLVNMQTKLFSGAINCIEKCFSQKQHQRLKTQWFTEPGFFTIACYKGGLEVECLAQCLHLLDIQIKGWRKEVEKLSI